MRHPLVASIVLALLIMLTACTRPPRGSIDLTIVGPDADAAASVVVTGPEGFEQTVAESAVLTGLAIGTYSVTPATAVAANDAHAGTERFGAAARTVEVVAGETAFETITYAYRGFNIPDPPGDAVGESMAQPIFDLTEMRSVVDGGDLTITLVLVEEQQDLEHLRGFVDLDVDRDAATGQPSSASQFCEADPDIGSEYEVSFTVVGEEALVFEKGDFDALATLPVVTAANTLYFTIPLSLIGGGDGRVHAATVVGNEPEPTDCIPFGEVVFEGS